jgi:hypothetical protein
MNASNLVSSVKCQLVAKFCVSREMLRLGLKRVIFSNVLILRKVYHIFKDKTFHSI